MALLCCGRFFCEAWLRPCDELGVQGASEDAVAAIGAPGPDDPQPLSEEELAEKEELLSSGFSNWNRRDFSAFTRACEKVGAPRALVLIPVQGR